MSAGVPWPSPATAARRVAVLAWLEDCSSGKRLPASVAKRPRGHGVGQTHGRGPRVPARRSLVRPDPLALTSPGRPVSDILLSGFTGRVRALELRRRAEGPAPLRA